jgi:2-methylisocitrate lyase-like PEP mutase family enzyme
MSVLHETEQRALLGRGRQQAEHGESDQEPVRNVTRCEAQGDVQRVLLGLRERDELVEHRRTELMDPGERELHLRLDSGDPRHTESRGLPGEVPEQRRLSDACLASHDQDGAITFAHLCQEAVEHLALASPVEEPGRKGGGHVAGKGNRRAEPATIRSIAHVQTADLQSRCDLLRSLQRPGDPLLLPNAWDVATARAVVAAGFPVVATTSGGVAPTLGYEDHERAPGDEMLAAAARIARGVDVPVTVDAEAGYGKEPAELAAALRSAGAAGCNLEDTDHAAGSLRDPDRHAEWLRAVRQAASEDDYPLVINARVDVFVGPWLAGAGPGTQEELVPEALRRANAYLEAGADSVYPIALWEADALRHFTSEVGGPVNVMRLPQTPSLAELAALGVARVSWAVLLYREAMGRFDERLASLRE